MRVSRWLMLIAIVVGLGCLQVAQRNTIFQKGYAVGAQMGRVHAQATDVSWLRAQVNGLASPTHLAHVAKDRRLDLVAWSTISQVHPVNGAMPEDAARSLAVLQDGDDTQGFAHMASLSADHATDGNDAAD